MEKRSGFIAAKQVSGNDTCIIGSVFRGVDGRFARLGIGNHSLHASAHRRMAAEGNSSTDHCDGQTDGGHCIPSNTGITGNIVAFTPLGKGFTQRRMSLFAANKKGPGGPFYHFVVQCMPCERSSPGLTI